MPVIRSCPNLNPSDLDEWCCWIFEELLKRSKTDECHPGQIKGKKCPFVNRLRCFVKGGKTVLNLSGTVDRGVLPMTSRN